MRIVENAKDIMNKKLIQKKTNTFNDKTLVMKFSELLKSIIKQVPTTAGTEYMDGNDI